jgi:N-acyl amino acid synthase of PEP-CTERM/exosortase system
MPMLAKFREYFQNVPVDTDELKQEVYKLRYQVYCLETGFEDPNDFPDRLERDAYDERSEHYLIRHKSSNEFAATTRLILPDLNSPHGIFPIEEHCKIEKRDLIDEIDPAQIGEVSRFCVSKNFKRRKGEPGTLAGIPTFTPTPSFSEDERRSFPLITLGLITCLMKISLKHGIFYWYAVMEPALIRFLSQLGINFTAIGPAVDYHGLRRPCFIKVDDLLASVKEKNIPLWEMLTNRGNFWNDEPD